MDENIKKIIDSLGEITPQAWKALVEYHQADAIAMAVVSFLIFSVSMYVAIRGLSTLSTASGDIDKETAGGVGLIFGTGIALMAFWCGVSDLVMAIHPEGSLINIIADRMTR
jgi:hypothetical protein